MMQLLCSTMMAIWSCSLPIMTSSLSFKICAHPAASHHLWLSSLRHWELLGPWHAIQELWKPRVLPPTLHLLAPPPAPYCHPFHCSSCRLGMADCLEGPQKYAAQPNVLGFPIPNLMHISSTPFERCSLWGCGIHSLRPRISACPSSSFSAFSG